MAIKPGGAPEVHKGLKNKVDQRRKAEEVLLQSEEQYRRIVETSQEGIWMIDAEGLTAYANSRMAELLGYQADEMLGRSVFDFMDEAARTELKARLARRVSGVRETYELRYQRSNGSDLWALVSGTPIHGENGEYLGTFAMITDIGERRQAEALLSGQNKVLEMIATSAPLEEVLEELCRLIESQAEGMLCSVFLLDEDEQYLRRGAAPNLPEDYTRAMDGVAIGPAVASCGTAAFRGEPVIVTDINEDPLWADYRDLAARHGLRACWSTPMFSHEGDVLGTFAMYYRDPRTPSPAETRLIGVATDIAGIAIERKGAEAALRASEEHYRNLFGLSPNPMWVYDDETLAFLDVNDAAIDAYGYSRDEFLTMTIKDIRPPSEIPELLEHLRDDRADLHGDDRIWTHRAKDNREFFVEVSSSSFMYQGRPALLTLARDVTKRLRAEEALRKVEERYRTLVEQIPAVTYMKAVVPGSPGRITPVYISPQVEQVLGYTQEEWLAHPESWFTLLHPDDRETFVIAGRRGVATGGAFHAEYRIVRRDGTVAWIRESAVRVTDDQGRPIYWHGFMLDVTEAKGAEEALRKAEERYRSLVEAIPATVYVDELDNIGLYISPQVEKLLGYSIEEWERDRHLWLPLLHPEDRQRVLEENPRSVDVGRWSEEYRLIAKDGRTVWIRDEAVIVNDGEGNPQYWQGIWLDVTARKQAEEALHESEERFSKAFRASPTPMAIARLRDGVNLDVNESALTMLGYARDEVIGKTFDEIGQLAPQERERMAERSAALYEHGSVRDVEVTYTTRSGEARVLLLSLQVISLGGEPCVLVAGIDITDRKRAEEERERFLARLVAAQEEERQRIAADIHDDSLQAVTAVGMRLAILRGRLSDPSDIASLEKLAGTIDVSIERLRHLLFELRPPALDKEGLGAAITQYLERSGDETGFQFRVEDELKSQPSIESRIVCYRIAQEALANIRKHARASEVAVTLGDRDGGTHVRVADDGVGFERNSTDSPPGHLGLSAMKERAELAGGWLRLTSAPDEGTVVEFWVPGQ